MFLVSSDGETWISVNPPTMPRSKNAWMGKLSIAKAFFSNADIIIFDKPTLALDSCSEAKIYEEIEKVEPNKIKVFTSYRMYNLKNATKIIVMSDGKILNIGDYNNLLLRNEMYKTIFNLQAMQYS